MPKGNNKVPVFTTGNIGEPSKPVIPTSNVVHVNAWNGQILDCQPTFSTPTGLPVGSKNEFFHGGIQINPNTVMYHGYGNSVGTGSTGSISYGRSFK
jgi:hypothetical protein